ncbi:MAG: MBL fold metallo-hydrolase, partial [Verrucomicrobiota bacterium]
FDDMRRYCDAKEGEAIPIYTNKDGYDRMRSIYPYAMMDKAKIKGYPAFSGKIMPEVLNLDGARISSVVQSHGSFETLGLVFEEMDTGKRFAYYTDCDSVSERGKELARGAEVAVLDGLKHTPHRSHMSIPEAVEVAREIGAGDTYLIHMTCGVDHDETNASLPEGVQLSYDDLVLEI